MTFPVHALLPLALGATLAAAAAAPQAPSQPPSSQAVGSRADAQRLLEKAARVAANGERRAPAALRTTISERELNAYLAYDGAEALPAGVTKPTLVLHGDRRVAGTAVVDLDAVRAERKPTGMLDPMGYLAGKLPVAASGFLEARNGVARFQLEAASVAGIPIPRMVLQEVVAFYTRSPEYPKGVNIDDPFPLPAGIKAIEVRRGEAVVVQ